MLLRCGLFRRQHRVAQAKRLKGLEGPGAAALPPGRTAQHTAGGYESALKILHEELVDHRTTNAQGRTRSDGDGAKVELSAEEKEALRALGYLTEKDTEWVDDAKPSGGANGSP